MATLLVVDDSALDRYVAGTLLEEHADWSIVYAEDGREALGLLKESLPDLVLTDLQMPEIDGLELTATIRRDYAAVPVVLMASHSSEEIAVAAVEKGAWGYVPKRNLARDLVGTVERLLNVARSNRDYKTVLESMAGCELTFILNNDVTRLQPLIVHFQDIMNQLQIADKAGQTRAATALHEALVNAIEHGNLEVDSELRCRDNRREYQRAIEKRRKEAPYKDRKVYLTATFTSAAAVFVIRDEGPGFDPARLPDPTDPANLENESGRGVFLIRTFMDEVRFNETGNEITMIKRRQ